MISLVIKLCILTTLLFIITKACDFKVVIVSSTDKDYFVQIKAPNGTASELFHFKKGGQKESLQVTGENCGLNMTTANTYKVNPDGTRGQRLHQTKAMLDGMGLVRYSLIADGQIMIDSRAGVMCAFAICGGRG
uniref:Uncharacterized protein n=1 Tax=Acrobeloides nanus TaxID=290746 RepID=A0A914CWY5_9BILA